VYRLSAPSVPHRTMKERVADRSRALRKMRLTGADIALAMGMPDLDRVGGPDTDRARQALAVWKPIEPANRYERARPGEL